MAVIKENINMTIFCFFKKTFWSAVLKTFWYSKKVKRQRVLVKYDAGALDAKIAIAPFIHITSLFKRIIKKLDKNIKLF